MKYPMEEFKTNIQKKPHKTPHCDNRKKMVVFILLNHFIVLKSERGTDP